MRKGFIATTLFLSAGLSILFYFLEPIDLESTLNAWYGLKSNSKYGLNPVTFLGIPVYAPFLSLGVKIPLLSGITNSPLAWISPYFSIFDLQFGLTVGGLVSTLVFMTLVIRKINPKFQTFYTLLLILTVLSTTWFYIFVNDWVEIALGYLGIIHLFLAFMALFAISENKKLNEAVFLILLGIGTFLVSLTHLGYLPAIVYPFIFFVLSLRPTSKLKSLNRSSKLVTFLLFVFLIFKQSQVLEAINFSKVENLRTETIKMLTSSSLDGSLLLLNNNFASRAIIFPIGFVIATILVLKLPKEKSNTGQEGIRRFLALRLCLTSIFSVFLVFFNNLEVIPSASQNWLFRDLAVWTGVSSWVLANYPTQFGRKNRRVNFRTVAAASNAAILAVFFTNIILGSAYNSISGQNHFRTKDNIDLLKPGHGGRILFDFDRWSEDFNSSGSKLDPREVQARGYASITGWPKMRGSMPFQSSDNPLEGKIDRLSCYPPLLQFLQVKWILTRYPCEIIGGNELNNGLRLYENNDFFVLKLRNSNTFLENCQLLESVCVDRILQNGSQIPIKYLQIRICERDCAYSLNFPMLPNASYLLPIKYDSGLYLKNFNSKKDLRIFQVGPFVGLSNSGKKIVNGVDLQYNPSIFQITSILSGIAHFCLVFYLSITFFIQLYWCFGKKPVHPSNLRL